MSTSEVYSAIGASTAEMTTVLAFNRVSGEFVFALANVKMADLSGADLMTYVETEFDSNTQTVVGTYPDYEIKLLSEMPEVIYEFTVDRAMATKITKVYPIAEQVNILGRAIKMLAEKAGIEIDELEEMLDYINTAREANREHKEAYKNDPAYEYISNDEIAAADERRYAGGLHEELGPRAIEGGRVFS
ncbi:hypothetical protein MZD04_gp189 [Pseudomonas phage Psa21]|uniref:Uncharacterized protein n=1 Tax=Pseudomonas phage Psa21 TaxID=2530023 RepID=A0A481W5D4_9CAUD|nr:hypothetical protein MZD04_gp189 [Pseudomonas phage Psa21]QBJ02715.1 hypothetical protein PSA21_189 [Pseudomonas phage Psa21]